MNNSRCSEMNSENAGLEIRRARLQAEHARTQAAYWQWRNSELQLRHAQQVKEIQDAVMRLCACESPADQAWAEHRNALAVLFAQSNTYCTWSLALSARPDEKIIYLASDSTPTVTPRMLGVTEGSSPTFLKALDLGGRDQREIASLLHEKNDKAAAEKFLVSNKKGDASRVYILTGGLLETRQRSAALLQKAFPSFQLVVIAPETEGRYTLLSAETELHRLALSSGGTITHVLLLAKGSTDIHMAWLAAHSGTATGAGTAATDVHKAERADPSKAKDCFHAFMATPANAKLAAAAEAGTCAVVFAGASVHAIGKQYAALGHYFRRLSKAELATSDVGTADFERHVGLEYLGGKLQVFLGATVHKSLPSELRSGTIPPMGTRRPQLEAELPAGTAI